MDIKWLKDFLVLSEVRNFSHAAKLRNITQPAFGRHIKALEEMVGQQLIDRSRTPIKLTSEGKQFQLVAKNIISQLDEGIKKINGEESSPSQPIKIAAPHTLSSFPLLKIINQYQSIYQHKMIIDILRVNEAIKAISNSHCDFYLGFDNEKLLQTPFEHKYIGKGHFLLVTANDNHNKPLFTPYQNKKIPMIEYSQNSYGARALDTYVAESKKLNTYPVFETSLCQLQKELVLSGQGIAWLPDVLINTELMEGKLTAIDPDSYQIPYQIRLYRNSLKLHKNAEFFWQQLDQIELNLNNNEFNAIHT
ncbi:LysR substrate-binding domain-containing protein [Vibrio sp. SS-MA-C1-2]|uniref:LysR substrate-binding domain-containing protein n=1 Tax=Vibrio sp. SS-MA-C1-2 TaxID=2908646 RepID=UPI001F2BB6DD|nr:LysR substrate-binding domain-containing protein [Vibrio sp. SS-MA-C1-2]UJF18873.1 LysR substrate-binding domain-containing protein [Vibrio sp. SS-MA-C1-2]